MAKKGKSKKAAKEQEQRGHMDDIPQVWDYLVHFMRRYSKEDLENTHFRWWSTSVDGSVRNSKGVFTPYHACLEDGSLIPGDIHRGGKIIGISLGGSFKSLDLGAEKEDGTRFSLRFGDVLRPYYAAEHGLWLHGGITDSFIQHVYDAQCFSLG